MYSSLQKDSGIQEKGSDGVKEGKKDGKRKEGGRKKGWKKEGRWKEKE